LSRLLGLTPTSVLRLASFVEFGVSRLAKVVRGLIFTEFSLFYGINEDASSLLRVGDSPVRRGSKVFAFCLSEAIFDD
jgi:hypothetical protein